LHKVRRPISALVDWDGDECVNRVRIVDTGLAFGVL